MAFNSLVQGDTLAEGFSFTGLSSSQTLNFEGYRHKQMGSLVTYNSGADGHNVTRYGGDNPVAITFFASLTYTPVDESGQDGNAWVVTYVDNNYVRFAGIYIAPDPYAPALDETTGHWNFLMPGSNKVVKAVLYDSIVLGPHVTVGAQPTPAFISYTRPGIGGDSTVLYYDPNTTQPSTFGFEAAANDGNGRNFAFWADDQTNHNTFRSFGNLSELTCGQRFVAVYPDNYTLALFTQSGGTLSLDGESVDSVYNITFYHGGSPDIMDITIPASRMPYDTTFDYGSTYVMGAEVTEASGKLSKIGEDNHTVTVRISGAFEGYGSYSCELEEGYDMWSITCEASTQPKTPYGISKTGTNTYSVMEGLTVNVTATPDSAHYLARIDGHDTVGNYATGYSFVMPSSDKDLMADFAAKPTLTLAQTDGGEMEIVPAGGPVWGDGVSNLILANNYTADGITFTSTNGSDIPNHGQWSAYSSKHFHFTSESGNFSRIEMVLTGNNNYNDWNNAEGWTVDANTAVWEGDANEVVIEKCTTYVKQITFVRGTANVIASSTPNTYIIDYGTPVTVVATPDAQHYLVSFSDDDPATERNSNIAVEKTYDSVTGPIDLSANFQAKPTLTLTANDGGTLTIDGVVTELDQMMAHLSDPIAPYTQFSVFLQSDGVLKDNVKTLTDAQAIALAQRIAQTTGNNNIRVLAYTHEVYGSKYLKFGKPDGNTNGNTVTMTSNLPYTIYYVNTFDLLPETYPDGVVAGTTANTYRVDYGTEVTVVATPDATHYLATLGEELVNSNDSIHRTFTMTAPVNLEADFRAKPVLTLAANDTSWGKVTLAGSNNTIDTIYSNTMASQELFNQMTVVDNNGNCGSNGEWIFDFFPKYSFCPSQAADDWLITPAIAMEAGKTYTVTVDGNCVSSGYPERFEVKAAAETTAVALSAGVQVIASTDVNSQILTQYTGTFTPTADGNYRIGIHAISDMDRGTLYVRNLSITADAIPAAIPAGVAKIDDTTYRVDYGTTLTLVADATELHHVQAWLDQNADTMAAAQYGDYFVTEPENLFPKNSTLTFTMTQDTVATAMFGINSYDVTAMMAAGQAERGTVKALYTDIQGAAQTAMNDTVEATAQGGSTTTLVAFPANSCFDFAYWQVGSEQIEKDTLTVTAATQAVAYFVYHQYTGDTTVDVCDQFDWHGLIYASVPEVAPTYTYKTVKDECDSVVTLLLTLRYKTTGDTTASECDQFSWFEHTGLTASTEELQHVFVNAVGCDSIVTLHLTIRYSNTGVETATACDQYEWQGSIYTESNTTDQRVLTNADNCDSTVTLNLTVNYHHDTTVYWQTSGDFVWGRGTTYQETFVENGTYNRTIDTKQGCDSNVTIVLAYLPHTTPLPTIYNIMGVSLFINHFPEGTDKIDYIYYRWYKNGEVVSEGEGVDSYSEDGDMLNGCFYLEISTEPTLTYWAQSNEVCLGNVGIDDVKDITMTLAPNPVVRGQQVNVTISESNLQGAVATVYDAQGRQVSNFEVRNSTFEIQTSNLTAGIYTVRIVLSDGRMATKKVVVK